MTEQNYEGHEIPIYSVKKSRKFKDIKATLLFNLYQTSWMVKNVCNIVLFLIKRVGFQQLLHLSLFAFDSREL